MGREEQLKEKIEALLSWYEIDASQEVKLTKALLQLFEKEMEEKNERINELTMANMTHEYDEAEAERFRPEYERQLLDPLQQQIQQKEQRIKELESDLAIYIELKNKLEQEKEQYGARNKT